MFKVTFTNSKLSGSIGSINLPALITCRNNAPCKKACYACKGTFKYPCVKNCYAENLNVFLNSPEKAEQDILSQLPSIGFIRWHSSGDIVNNEYFEMMIRIAKKAKQVKFLCFTKKYEIVNNYLASGKKIPSNLKIVFSNWIDWKCENPYNLPFAEIYDSKVDNEVNKKSLPCSGECSKCFVCWNLKKGQSVVFNKH